MTTPEPDKQWAMLHLAYNEQEESNAQCEYCLCIVHHCTNAVLKYIWANICQPCRVNCRRPSIIWNKWQGWDENDAADARYDAMREEQFYNEG